MKEILNIWKVQEQQLFIAVKKMGWKEISCCINGCMKSKEDIYEEIINCLNQNIDISKFIWK